jgi:hypothetical protein
MKTTREIALTLIAEMPELTGTEKQIAYAKDLRIKRIEVDVIRYANSISRKRENRGEEAVTAMLEKIGAVSEEDYIMKKIKADPMSAFNAHKFITSAKDVIEYRVYF